MTIQVYVHLRVCTFSLKTGECVEIHVDQEGFFLFFISPFMAPDQQRVMVFVFLSHFLSLSLFFLFFVFLLWQQQRTGIQ